MRGCFETRRSGCATEFHDREMFLSGVEVNVQFDDGSWMSAHQNVGVRAGRASRPARAGLESRSSGSWASAEVNLARGLGSKVGVRSLAVVPGGEGLQLPQEGGETEGDENPPGALVLQRSDQPLHDRNAPVLANGTEALADLVATAPATEAGGDAVCDSDQPRAARSSRIARRSTGG